MVYINFNDTGEQDLIDEFDDGMQGFEFTPPTVLVCGVGGCGGNAVQNIASTGIKNVKFLAANTDGVALRNNINPKLSSLLLLGPNKLQGRGSGNNYEIAREAAEESYQLIKERLQKIQLLILIAGESKGTGTGATPVIAKCARELDKKIIAIVTTPFKNQQACAMNNAIEGINRLKEYVDCYIIIPNENLKRLNKPNIGMYEAQLIIDEKITEITKSIVDILVTPGYQNIDYSDIANTINQSGQAHIAFTRVEGTDKVDRAIEELSNNVLLDTSIVGARRIIIYITSPHDFTLSDHDKLVSAITGQAHPDVTVITGSRYDDDLGDAIEVTLIATSFDQEYLSHTNENVPVNEELDKKKIGFEGSTLSDQLIAPISETTYEELQEQPAHISEPVETEQIPELEPAISLPQPMIITAEHPVVSIPEPIPEPLRELSQATVNAPEKKRKG